jgi:hypothetical protein
MTGKDERVVGFQLLALGRGEDPKMLNSGRPLCMF